MTLPAVTAVNTAYEGLGRRLATGTLGAIRAVHIPAVSAFITEVKKLQRDEESWTNLPIDDLRKQLRITRVDLRGIAGPEHRLEEYWKQREDQLQSDIRTVSSFIPSETLEVLNTLAKNISRWGIDAGLALAEELTRQPADGPIGLFLASPRLTELARNWNVASLFPEGSRILSRSDINTVEPSEFREFVVLNSPGAVASDRGGPEGPNLLRAMFFGAGASEVIFITPANFTRETDTQIPGRLLPQDFGPQEFLLKFDPVGEPDPVLVEQDNELESLDELFEEVPQANPVQMSDAPHLQKGAQSCRLIHLQSGLALPVETDSLWVTRLSRDIDGIWRGDTAHPFRELQEGNLLLAPLDASESADLRRRARTEMGEQFDDFAKRRDGWKTRLKLAAGPHSPGRFISNLRRAGLQNATRYEHWLQDDAVAPQTNADFRKLLAFLGYEEQEITATMRLTKQWRAALIAEGQRPGREIADFLNREEHDELHFSQGRTVVLEELGNARFLISPVASISETAIDCDPSQVRRVVRIEKG